MLWEGGKSGGDSAECFSGRRSSPLSYKGVALESGKTEATGGCLLFSFSRSASLDWTGI